jgi:hypothetical protein
LERFEGYTLGANCEDEIQSNLGVFFEGFFASSDFLFSLREFVHRISLPFYIQLTLSIDVQLVSQWKSLELELSNSEEFLEKR